MPDPHSEPRLSDRLRRAWPKKREPWLAAAAEQARMLYEALEKDLGADDELTCLAYSLTQNLADV